MGIVLRILLSGKGKLVLTIRSALRAIAYGVIMESLLRTTKNSLRNKAEFALSVDALMVTRKVTTTVLSL